MISIPLLLVVTVITFVLNSIAPGDLASTLLHGEGTDEQYFALREELGLDRPMLVQYGSWMVNALQGDLGRSYITGESVASMLNSRVGVTASLIAGALLVCVSVGLVLGITSALQGGIIGRSIDILSMLGLILPSFWVALVFIAIFAVSLRWLPAVGYTSILADPKMWFLGLILPVLSISLHSITTIAKQTRDSMSDVMTRDFIRALRASGVPERSVIWKHALRNAALPVVTVIGLMMVSALSSTVFIERVFVLPGLGGLAVQSALQKDITLLQGTILYFTLITIAINLLVDISYGWINPKVRLS